MNDLFSRLTDLADEMTGTNYVDLRRRVNHRARQLGRRRAAYSVAVIVVAAGALTGGGYLAAERHGGGSYPGERHPSGGVVTTSHGAASPTAAPSTTPSGEARTITAVPGTLTYLTVVAGRPITLTRVTDGAAVTTTFGTAGANDHYVAVPSPDGAMIALISSPDPGNVQPGDLVIVRPGGQRRTVAHGVAWGGGLWPAWTPDSTAILLPGTWGEIDVTTGATRTAPILLGHPAYVTWSGNGTWVGYASGGDKVAVSHPDGTGSRTVSVAGLPQCQASCPSAVQAVSEDGRYVAVALANTDPGHTGNAQWIIDMRTGKLVTMRQVTGGIAGIYFRSDGGWVVHTVTNGTYRFTVTNADGTVAGSFPDTYQANGDGPRLVAYRP